MATKTTVHLWCGRMHAIQAWKRAVNNAKHSFFRDAESKRIALADIPVGTAVHVHSPVTNSRYETVR